MQRRPSGTGGREGRYGGWRGGGGGGGGGGVAPVGEEPGWRAIGAPRVASVASARHAAGGCRACGCSCRCVARVQRAARGEASEQRGQCPTRKNDHGEADSVETTKSSIGRTARASRRRGATRSFGKTGKTPPRVRGMSVGFGTARNFRAPT